MKTPADVKCERSEHVVRDMVRPRKLSRSTTSPRLCASLFNPLVHDEAPRAQFSSSLPISSPSPTTSSPPSSRGDQPSWYPLAADDVIGVQWSLLANLARTCFRSQVQLLDVVYVGGELTKGIERLQLWVAEDVVIVFPSLWVLSVWGQVRLRRGWVTYSVIPSTSTLTHPDTVSVWDLGVIYA